MIVLYPDPDGDGYKGKVYEDFPVPNSDQHRDYAIVRFADELPRRPDQRGTARNLRMLGFAGRLALGVRDYVLVRYWSIRAYVQTRLEHGREVELLEIAADPIVVANSNMTQRTSEDVQRSDLSAA